MRTRHRFCSSFAFVFGNSSPGVGVNSHTSGRPWCSVRLSNFYDDSWSCVALIPGNAASTVLRFLGKRWFLCSADTQIGLRSWRSPEAYSTDMRAGLEAFGRLDVSYLYRSCRWDARLLTIASGAAYVETSRHTYTTSRPKSSKAR